MGEDLRTTTGIGDDKRGYRVSYKEGSAPAERTATREGNGGDDVRAFAPVSLCP